MLLAGGSWRDTFRLTHAGEQGATWDPAGNPNFREPAASDPYALLCALHDRHPRRIDCILTNSAIPRENVLDSQVVLTPRGGVCASDHYGVMTAVKW